MRATLRHGRRLRHIILLGIQCLQNLSGLLSLSIKVTVFDTAHWSLHGPSLRIRVCFIEKIAGLGQQISAVLDTLIGQVEVVSRVPMLRELLINNAATAYLLENLLRNLHLMRTSRRIFHLTYIPDVHN